MKLFSKIKLSRWNVISGILIILLTLTIQFSDEKISDFNNLLFATQNHSNNLLIASTLSSVRGYQLQLYRLLNIPFKPGDLQMDTQNISNSQVEEYYKDFNNGKISSNMFLVESSSNFLNFSDQLDTDYKLNEEILITTIEKGTYWVTIKNISYFFIITTSIFSLVLNSLLYDEKKETFLATGSRK